MNPIAIVAALLLPTTAPAPPAIVRTVASGPWSAPSTWDGGKPPGRGDRVQIRRDHVVTFDAVEDVPIRSIHVAGTLRFDPDRDARLTVGLLKIQDGDDPDESAAIRDAMDHRVGEHRGAATLEVGTFDRPIAANRSVTIRLAAVEGLAPDDFPAIVCVGGRLEMHGSPMSRTWLKLGEPARAGASEIRLSEPVEGWKVGDRILLTSTRHQFAKDAARTPHVLQESETETRTIREIRGDHLTIDAPLDFSHSAEGGNRGEVANLSRNVVVESADPGGIRGHTMFHRGSSGSISFAEFRHLGKSGKLGRYSLHFHRGGDSMRGFSVVGASIIDSANRWITIHGTNSIVVRDCVGYRSEGHGFFLEDATEAGNILDRNLAIQAIESRPLPGQHLAFDRNEGAGFWWASGGNAFLRNVSAESDGYGFRFDPPPDAAISPFLLFEKNEAHAQRRHGLKLGGRPDDGPPGSTGIAGPDGRHPLAIRDFRVWDSHWGFSPGIPSVLVDGLRIDRCDFGFWRPVFDRLALRNVSIERTRWPFFANTGTPPETSAYPAPLDPVDDRPPTTVITRIGPPKDGRVLVQGVAVDDVSVRSVKVNGRAARFPDPGAPDWEVVIDLPPSGGLAITAVAEDSSGNVEKAPHSIRIPGSGSDSGQRH